MTFGCVVFASVLLACTNFFLEYVNSTGRKDKPSWPWYSRCVGSTPAKSSFNQAQDGRVHRALHRSSASQTLLWLNLERVRLGMFVSLMHVYCVTNVYSHANACTHTHTPCLQVLMSIVMERLDCRPVQSLSPLLQIAVVPFWFYCVPDMPSTQNRRTVWRNPLDNPNRRWRWVSCKENR